MENVKDKLKRIQEINKIRNELARERNELEKSIKEEREKEIFTERIKFVGKCFELKKGKISESYPNVIAFKIISIDENQSFNYAKCLSVCDGTRYTCWPERGILMETLGLWTSDSRNLMVHEDSELTIDYFEEIDEEKFNKIYENILDEIL